MKVGHVPEKSVIPRTETIEEIRASCLHASPGAARMPQNDMDAATNPIVKRTQKLLATVLAVVPQVRETTMIERAAKSRREHHGQEPRMLRSRRHDQVHEATALRQ